MSEQPEPHLAYYKQSILRGMKTTYEEMMKDPEKQAEFNAKVQKVLDRNKESMKKWRSDEKNARHHREKCREAMKLFYARKKEQSRKEAQAFAELEYVVDKWKDVFEKHLEITYKNKPN